MPAIIDHLKEIFPGDTHRRVFLVGGAVRDMLLGRERTDIDLTAALTAGEFAALGFHLVEGKSTAPIWHRHMAGLGTIEVTPLPDVAGLADDLRRRDFSINAMAITLTGDVIDPLDARADLQQRRLSACSRHAFIDDPLRVFRAFRFAADGWQMTPACKDLLGERDWDRDLVSVPVERFSREMLKALEKPAPERFFQLMLETGTGRIYLPELFRMPCVPAGPPEHHPEKDLFSHSIQVLQRVTATSRDPLARFCGFFHDIGKLATDPAGYPRHHGHDLTGFAMSDTLCRRLRLPARYGRTLAWVSRLHGTFNLWGQLRDSTRIRLAGQALKVGMADILPLVSQADKAGGCEPEGWREALEIAGMPAAELGIDLQVLEGMQPSRRTDLILQRQVERFRSTRTASS